MCPEDLKTQFEALEMLPLNFSTIQRPSVRRGSGPPEVTGKSPALRLIEPPSSVEKEDCLIWYIGEDGRGLLNLQMTNAGVPVS